ncbi:MAG: outer membrane lipoprotein-sorting protein [Bacteroidales bacterium]|nr:outer membrane lipoprotein-sorting protein [Bacteroidales bacterium]
MKTFKLSVLACAFVMLTGTINYVKSQDVNEILQKVDKVLYSAKDQQNKVTIILIDKSGSESKREADVIQKGNDMRLFRFTSPASQAGIAFLSLPKDVMYIYMPAFGKERRIASHVKNQKFAGTDFSYDDMEAKLLSSKYDPELIDQDNETYTLKLVPKPGLKTDYSKQVMKINKQDFYPVTAEYFDKGGNKVKEATYQYEKVGNYWSAKEILMKDIKRNHATKMIVSDVIFDQGLSDDEFTVRKLKQ